MVYVVTMLTMMMNDVHCYCYCYCILPCSLYRMMIDTYYLVLGDPTKSRERYDDVPWVLLDDGRVVILYHWMIDGGGVLLVRYYYYCSSSLISYIIAMNGILCKSVDISFANVQS